MFPTLKENLSIDLARAKEMGLKTDYKVILKQKKKELDNILIKALEDYSSLELAESARKFRQIAQSLKHIESLICDPGNHTDRNTLNDLSGKDWIKHTKSWIVVDGHRKDFTTAIKDHPASFPPALIEHFIKFFTKQGQWVMDPFLGIGSTAAACYTTDRNCMGVELNEKYADYSKDRIEELNKNKLKTDVRFEIINSDARDAVKNWKVMQLPQIDFLITSPPYWNMLKHSRGGVKSSQKKRVEKGMDAFYSKKSEDLGNIDNYDEYLTALVSVFNEMKPLLKPKAYLMVILQNCRPKDGVMRPLAWDFAQKMAKHFILRQEFIWCQDRKFAGIWGYPTTYVSNVHHHYCLIFQKEE
ncbi:MAG: DNA methyltransferase [Promethearchaeota archaeon]